MSLDFEQQLLLLGKPSQDYGYRDLQEVWGVGVVQNWQGLMRADYPHRQSSAILVEVQSWPGVVIRSPPFSPKAQPT